MQNIFAKKSLGQHFLNSKSVLDKIIAAANIKPGETILEIGPGKRILTDALIEKGARVIAVEKDSRISALGDWQKDQQHLEGQLTFINEDILDFNVTPFLGEDRQYAIVANIPYYITGAILQKFLEDEPRPNRMILLVQKEVADRIVANDAAGNKESILSISVKAFGLPKIIDKVPRGSFSPPPNVDSAILSISNISDAKFIKENIDIKKFFTLVRAGFAHKRKLLKRNLEDVAPQDKIEDAWNKLALPKNLRAEELNINKWFELAKIL